MHPIAHARARLANPWIWQRWGGVAVSQFSKAADVCSSVGSGLNGDRGLYGAWGTTQRVK